MTSFRIRSARPEDTEDLLRCWQDAFGDDADFVRDILSSASLTENAVVAEQDGHACSAFFAFDGLGFNGITASYLYALGTRREYRGRGMGAAVCRGLTEQCFRRGADMVCLAPADEGLVGWYRRTQGMEVLLRAADRFVSPAREDGGAVCEPIGPADYARLRAGMARPLAVTRRLLAAQDVLYRHFGGAMLRIALNGRTALACAERSGGAILVRELLCAGGDIPPALRAVSGWFGGGDLLLRRRAEQGRPLMYRMRDGRAFPAVPPPLFPFTLE